eukprot:4195116-Prymnesium_polylepis.1
MKQRPLRLRHRAGSHQPTAAPPLRAPWPKSAVEQPAQARLARPRHDGRPRTLALPPTRQRETYRSPPALPSRARVRRGDGQRSGRDRARRDDFY